MIRIFTHVGLDPRNGGGVATYVRNLAAVLSTFGRAHEILSVSQFSKFFMLISFLRYFSFRGPVLLNSALHPFSLLMILFSRSKNLIVMPHGEFLNAALKLNKNKKFAVLRILKWLSKCFGASEHVTVVATSEAEVNNFAKYISVQQAQIVQDVVHLRERPIQERVNPQDKNNRLHVVMIGRMVRVKGFKKVLDDLAVHSVPAIEKISIYYLAEDPAYLAEVEEALGHLQRCGMDVVILEGRDADKIYADCKDTNSILVVPSEFESFSYALVENLWMPNKPIVSFENQLTSYLVGQGHCRLARGNRFADAIRSSEPADISAVHDLIHSYADAINKHTIKILYGVET